MNPSKALKIGALVCFVLSTFGLAFGAVTLVPLGLALYVAAELLLAEGIDAALRDDAAQAVTP